MANAVNQFYYVDQGRPILKTEYDDGSEDFYDASGQFSGHTFSHLNNGEVFDPYADIAHQEAGRQQQLAQSPLQNPQRDVLGDLGQTFGGGGGAMPTPLGQPQKPPNLDDPSSMRAQQPPGSNVGGGGAMTNSPTATPVGPPGQDRRSAQEMGLYDWAGGPSAARQAMINAMARSGQTFQLANNPYIDRLLSAAPGLAMSFMAQRGAGGATESDTQDSFGQFGQFLKQALGSGQVFSTLGNTRNMMPQIVEGVRGFNQASQVGPGHDANDPRLSNPFIRKLAELFSAANGQGALTSYGQLLSPMMSAGQQRGFSDIMDTRYGNAALGFYGDPNRPGELPGGGDPNNPMAGGNDWFKYLFGY